MYVSIPSFSCDYSYPQRTKLLHGEPSVDESMIIKQACYHGSLTVRLMLPKIGVDSTANVQSSTNGRKMNSS